MENKKIVVGNMKMNMLLEDLIPYLKKINGKIKSDRVVICPSDIYIPYFLKHDYKVGVQNVFYRTEGAYTGETSPKQAIHMGVEYAIIGHSERRLYFKETDLDINKKVYESLNCGVKVILCIGETLEEKNMLKTAKVLKKQLSVALKNISMLNEVYIAYEPVWAIGTSVIPTIKDIEKTAIFIKQTVKEMSDYDDIKVLYGGSVTDKNIKEIVEIKEISGVLVGGASTDPDKFLKIIEVALKG